MTGILFLTVLYIIFSQCTTLCVMGLNQDENLLFFKGDSRILKFLVLEIIGLILCIPFVLFIAFFISLWVFASFVTPHPKSQGGKYV